MVLVKFQKDYADEFDVSGFKLFSEKEWDEYLKAIKEIEFPYFWSFGTNEELEFDSYNDFISSLTALEISDKTGLLIVSLSGKQYGNFPDAFL